MQYVVPLQIIFVFLCGHHLMKARIEHFAVSGAIFNLIYSNQICVKMPKVHAC